ncbi:MAG: hypothetical protein WBF42_05850, partial [Terracidiphilus sp.]
MPHRRAGHFYTVCMADISVTVRARKRSSGRAPVCGWKLERAARQSGAQSIAGLDEVGRGPMFGPVVAAAVILAPGTRFRGLTDSKKLPEKKRTELDIEI